MRAISSAAGGMLRARLRGGARWEDWELPCYVTSFLTVVILGVGLNAKPDLTLETWAHQKALERLQQQELASAEAQAEFVIMMNNAHEYKMRNRE
uniref:NADH-ubiquinone oxidoreductase ESSS subunit n=1 Tax=Oryza barthii TaxID=65489 RepID=A0A0D3H8A4_9ORYZ